MSAPQADFFNQTTIPAAYLRTFFEYSSDFVLGLSKTGQIVFTGDAVEQLLGYPPPEILHADFFSYLPPADCLTIKNSFQEIAVSRAAKFFPNLKIRHKNGTWRIFEATLTCPPHAPDNTEIIIIARDITELAQARRAAHYSETRFRMLFDNMASGVAVYEAVDNGDDFIFVDINQAGLVIGQLSRESTIGKRVTTVFPGIDQLGLLSVFRQVWQDGQPRNHPLTLYVDERITQWVENKVYKLPSGELVAIYDDITKQKEIEYALEHNNRWLRLMVEQLPGGAVYVDKDTLHINRAVEEITGYRRDELSTLSDWFSSLYGNKHAEIRSYYEQDKKNGFREPRTVSLTRKDGQQRHITFLAYQYPQGEIWLLSDITNQHLAEERIRNSLAEKEVLLKEIHHRVKNNLQVIHSLLSLQASQFEDQAVIEALQDSQNRVRSMALVHEKLYQSDDLVHVNPVGYIQSLVHQLFNSYHTLSRVIRFESHIDETILLNIDQAIPCGLIINELVTNSLKHAFLDEVFQGDEGKITVSLQPVGENLIELKVADNGAGLPPNFDFYDTTSLGMQLVRMLTRQLGGKLCTSRLDSHGATGTIVQVVFEV